jgi:hypothetical protein
MAKKKKGKRIRVGKATNCTVHRKTWLRDQTIAPTNKVMNSGR